MADRASATGAIRAVVRGEVQGVGFRDATVRRARALDVAGWVRNGEHGTVEVHAEGAQQAVDELLAFLRVGPPLARAKAHNTFEGTLEASRVIVWDHGTYEQGGRVGWPEALDRGHAVFVLHGEKLRGGFALQRTRAGAKPQWLLIKRRDESARPGSDIVAEFPRSVLSGRTLDETLE